MAQAVTLMMASRGCSIFGSGTVSQRMSPLPCQHSAFIRLSSIASCLSPARPSCGAARPASRPA